jgi:hypothetical protein
LLNFLLSSKRGLKNKKEDPRWLFLTIKLKKRYKDIILAAITSHIPADFMESEIILEPEESTGLLKRSLLRTETNQINQTDQIDQINHYIASPDPLLANQTNETDEINQTDQIGEMCQMLKPDP